MIPSLAKLQSITFHNECEDIQPLGIRWGHALGFPMTHASIRTRRTPICLRVGKECITGIENAFRLLSVYSQRDNRTWTQVRADYTKKHKMFSAVDEALWERVS